MSSTQVSPTVRQVRRAGGEEIGHLYDQVMRWYASITTPTCAQQDIFAAAQGAVLRVIRTREHTPAEDAFTIARNVLRFCVVPETHITAARRMEYIRRAQAPEDVYAYGSVDSPTGIINAWDTDTRLILYPLDRWAWTVQRLLPVMQGAYPTGQWTLPLLGHLTDEPCTITVEIARQPQEALETYGQRAQRIGQMIEGEINFYELDPRDPDSYGRRHF